MLDCFLPSSQSARAHFFEKSQDSHTLQEAHFSSEHNTGQQIFGLVFYFYFLVFLDVFWCAESENDVSFFVVSAVFL